MPELPEVETVVRDLRGLLVGRTIIQATILHPKPLRYPSTAKFLKEVKGKKVNQLRRRAKFIFCELKENQLLVFHLAMTGHLSVVPKDTPLVKHTHLVLLLDNNQELRFRDSRRFGRVLLGTEAELLASGKLPALGVEPLSADFTLDLFKSFTKASRRPLKALLLDQAKIVGLGNIYVDEACFLARVRPSRTGGSLSNKELKALFLAIPPLLEQAITNRGSSVDDFLDIWDAKGKQQEVLNVYGREHQICPRCGGIIEKTTVAGRGTHYCPVCQK